MTRPDDSFLDTHQLDNVRRHADRVLREAAALGRFPTPVDDIMESAKLIVVEDKVLDEGLLQHFVNKSMSGMKAGVAAVKNALSKVLGLFDAQDRLVIIDRATPQPRIPFIKLHEAGHGSLPHQRKLYRIVQDCEQTIDPDITDLFEREANVFASEVLFQGEVFSTEAHDQLFSIKVPMKLATKFGASQYSTFRRYVTTNPCACCVVVLERPVSDIHGNISAEVRRVITSRSFEAIYDDQVLTSAVTGAHPLAAAIPIRRMTLNLEVLLSDRNGDERICLAEALDTKHHILILVRDFGKRVSSGIVLPSRWS